MQEIHRPASELYSGGGSSDMFSSDGDSGLGLVTVSNNGLYNERLPLANMTISEVRARFGDRLDIDPLSQAELDGREVGEETVVRAEQLLTFVRRAGEKGSRRAW